MADMTRRFPRRKNRLFAGIKGAPSTYGYSKDTGYGAGMGGDECILYISKRNFYAVWKADRVSSIYTGGYRHGNGRYRYGSRL